MKKTLTIFFSVLVFSATGYAQDQQDQVYAEGKILSSYESVGSFKTLDMALALSLDEGWYTYWRAPGDTGLPPKFDWSRSTNVKDVAVFWPAPRRFQTADLYSFGYDGTTLFPLGVFPEKPGEPIELSLTLDLVICNEICVPATVSVTRSLPAGGAARTPEKPIIEKARASLPSAENTKTLGLDTAVLSRDAIVVTAYAKSGFREDADLFVDAGRDTIVTAKPEFLQDESNPEKSVIRLRLPEGSDTAQDLFGKTVRVVLVNGDESIEKMFSF